MTRRILALAAILLCLPAYAAELPVNALTATPDTLKLKGTDDAPQLIITGKRADGRDIDLSRSVTYSVSDPKVIRVEPNGRVFPLADGAAEITATFEGMTVKVAVTAEKMDAPLADQPRTVVPVFTKLRCSPAAATEKSRPKRLPPLAPGFRSAIRLRESAENPAAAA